MRDWLRLGLLGSCVVTAVACASNTEAPTSAEWDCHEAVVPHGHTRECTSRTSSAATADSESYYCAPSSAASDACPADPAASAAASSASDYENGDGYHCTHEDGVRTCKKAPTCGDGAHRVQMDCEPDQSAGLGSGGSDATAYPGGGSEGHEATPGVKTQCYFPAGAPAGTAPAATFSYVIQTFEGVQHLHMRLIFSPYFVDNSYGASSVGWAKQHAFNELVGSDHAELSFLDTAGAEKLHFKMDYISKSTAAPSGYACLGVTGGEGRMILGDAGAITKVSSSLDRNLNERGYGQYVVDSPATNATFAPSTAAPAWDYRVVYEAWIKNDAFGAAGYGDVKLAYVHASPSKANSNTLPVTPGECPAGWSDDGAWSSTSSGGHLGN